MLTQQIIETVQRMPSGGIITDTNRFDNDYVLKVVNYSRGNVLKEVYQKNNKNINPQCYQKHWVQKEVALQDEDCILKFPCPNVISFDEHSDGIRYVGSVQGSFGFDRVRSRGYLSTMRNHKVMSASNGIGTSVLYDASAGVLEVYGNMFLTAILVEGIFTDPLSIPTFNKDFDQYPLNDDLLPMLLDDIFRITAVEANTKPDYINNGTDSVPSGGVPMPNQRRR